MIISIIVLTAILIAAQLILSIKQIKKGAPDGRLLIITIVFSVIWIPLSVFRLIYSLTPLKISWFIITVVYMIFTIWYTNSLSKQMKH